MEILFPYIHIPKETGVFFGVFVCKLHRMWRRLTLTPIQPRRVDMCDKSAWRCARVPLFSRKTKRVGGVDACGDWYEEGKAWP